MTIKLDVLNELNLQDELKFKELAKQTETQETSLSTSLTSMKKDGLIDQVDELYYITNKGKQEIEPILPAVPLAPPMPVVKFITEQKNSTQDHSEPSKEKPSTNPITDQINKLKQQLNAKTPENIALKIQVCEEIGELLSDDLREILLDISADYKKLSGVN